MWRFIAAVLVCAACCSGAGAAEFYFGGGLGDTGDSASVSRPFEVLGVESRDDGGKVFGGVGLGRNLAVEATYYDLGGRSCCPRLADVGFETELDGLAAALVARLPRGRLEFFAKAGMLFWEENGDEITLAGLRPIAVSGSDPALGVGLLWRAFESFSVGLEWESLDLADTTFDGFWVSARVHF